jgi:hypothetical protein
MFGLLKPKLAISDDEFAWMLACTKWFTQEFEGIDRLRQTPLVRSHLDFFPPSQAQGHDRAREIFEQVKTLADMADWHCDLMIGESDPDPHIATGIALQREGPSAPGGTFGMQEDRVVITYNPDQLETPHDLVATFAHELAHYLMHSARSLPPGGEALEEHATDFCAVLLGFGAFSTNAAATFEQFQNEATQGWHMRRLGYLSELALVTAYALFVLLTDADKKIAMIELKPYLHAPFRKALAAIEHRAPDVVAEVERADLEAWG